MIASSEPTSCSSTSAGSTPWIVALDRGEPLEHRSCDAERTRSAMSAASSSSKISRTGRCGTCSWCVGVAIVVDGRERIRVAGIGDSRFVLTQIGDRGGSNEPWVTTLAQVAPTPQRCTRSKVSA